MTYLRRPKARVQWKPEEKPSAYAAKAFPHVADSTDPEELEIRLPYLYKGALWHTDRPLWDDFRYEYGYVKHEYNYLVSHRDSSPRRIMAFPVGTIAIYLGETHVEELAWAHQRTRRYVRHMFLVGTKIFMAAELRDFVPVF